MGTTGSTFEGFNNLFHLSDPLANRPFRGSVEDKGLDRLFRGGRSPGVPTDIGWLMGGQPLNVIWTGDPAVVLLHESLLEQLEVHRITGWRAYPVRLHGRDEQEVEGYAGLSITGRCGELKDDLSEQVIDQTPFDELELRFKGRYFDPSTWDGSDFFTPSTPTYYRFLTRRARRALARAGIKNVRFVPLTDIKWDKP